MNIYRPHIFDFESLEKFNLEAEKFISSAIFEANSEFGEVRLCLAGGNTPLPIYQRLAKNLSIPWSKLEIYQTDERYIDPNNLGSNQFNIKQAFGNEILDEVVSHFFETKLPIKQAVANYQELLETLDGIWFDLVVLGIGADGHFASLFPNGNYFTTNDSVLITDAPDYLQISSRISLSTNSLLNSKQILVLLKGKEKSGVLADLLESTYTATSYPAKQLLAHPNLTIFQCLEN